MDGGIQDKKTAVHDWEDNANRYGEELKQLESTIKEEGLFCVEWCVVSMSTIQRHSQDFRKGGAKYYACEIFDPAPLVKHKGQSSR